MSEYQHLTSSPVMDKSQLWIVDNVQSIITNLDEDSSAIEESQNDTGSNNVTITNVSNVTTTSLSSQGVTIRAHFQLDDGCQMEETLQHSKSWTPEAENLEKKRGVLRNEYQNLSEKLRLSFLAEEMDSLNVSVNKISPSMYLLDKHHDLKMGSELNEQSPIKLFQPKASTLSDLNCELQIPAKVEPFYFEEIESEKLLNLTVNESASDSALSSVQSFKSSNYNSSLKSHSSSNSSMHNQACQLTIGDTKIRKTSILNKNAVSFKPCKQSVSVKNTSTPTYINNTSNDAQANFSKYWSSHEMETSFKGLLF